MKFLERGKTRNRQSGENNRLNLAMAVVFLLGLSLVTKLYFLQVRQFDFYTTKADNQHNFFATIEPERGRIFINDYRNDQGGNLYPIATNKKFALVFAVPKELRHPNEVANELYIFFKKEAVEKEVDELLKKEDEDRIQNEIAPFKDLPEAERKIKEDAVMKNLNALFNDKTWKELRVLRREKEIKERQKKLIDTYLAAFDKPDSAYAVLEQKVDDEVLKKFFIALAADITSSTVAVDEKTAKQLDNIRSIKDFLKPDNIKIEDERRLVVDTVIKGKNGEVNKKVDLIIPGMGFEMKIYRYYPEKEMSSHVLGFVSYGGDKPEGQYGLEGFFNEEFYGKPGFVKAQRGAGGALVIINDRQYQAPENGDDVILTMDRVVQYTACQKIATAVKRHGADSGSIVILEPHTGAVIAMCGYPDFDPNNYRDVEDINVYNNQAVFSQYEPGSIFKIITMAAALDQGKVTPDTTYNDTGVVTISGFHIKNSDLKAHGVVNMVTVLDESLNTGVIFAMRQIGVDSFTRYVQDFGFGEKAGIELDGEASGDIRNLQGKKMNTDLYAATASFGQGLSVTPLQIAASFGAIANGGVLMKPYIVKEVIHADGSKIVTEPEQIRRVISEKTATVLGGMLVSVVEKGHGKKAGVKGYYVGGKTGTAQVPRKDGRGYQSGVNIGSFAGFAPVSDPRFAMIVRIDHPRDVAWAESSAAPIFGEMAEFLLNYYQVPKEREIIEKK